MYCVGIDIGSVSISTVVIDDSESILSTDYRFHYGKIPENLKDSLTAHGVDCFSLVSRTAHTPDIISSGMVIDDRIAYMTAARKRFPETGSLLIIGGEHFSLIQFDEDGSYRRLTTSSSCAAGTGSFLDQQVGRLGLKDSADMSARALVNIHEGGTTPKIASRCSVFAKTDLIHAQADGYSLQEICDGLCYGLAKNITDILVTDEPPPKPIVCTGGVSKNVAVRYHLEKILKTELLTSPDAHTFGAYGAALQAVRMSKAAASERPEDVAVPKSVSPEQLIHSEKISREYHYPPLSLKLSSYPDFSSAKSFLYTSEHCGTPVEVDIYTEFPEGANIKALLGMDIGSTSTKAVLTSLQGVPIAGFYTRTAGKPMEAVKTLFQATEHISQEYDIQLSVEAAGTTGSGRKFIGKIIGADLVVDEITAHAKAAFELNPAIDTIIEIGGQDSKFTTMKNGMVTFSRMNTICAAGTGSFIEEQATKLNVPLSEYTLRAEKANAPLTSDRCTVFMERDINHYLNKNYTVDEVLAAALYSVRDNYFQKVISSSRLGEHICFQGATAKNKTLVAAFEEKVNRPIYVSKYCHLTGALGAALILRDEFSGVSRFRGIDLHRKSIPIKSETCTYCNNHCRIRIADVSGETVAFGFLCGRDYDTQKFVETGKSAFSLLKTRENIFSLPRRLKKFDFSNRKFSITRLKKSKINIRKQEPLKPVIGIPAGLHLAEDILFWKYFFTELMFKVITSENFPNPLKAGKPLTGAEFCAPMTAFHGHADFVAEKADCLFMPIYLQSEPDGGAARNLCYYTQYSSSITAAVIKRQNNVLSLIPLIRPHDLSGNIRELFTQIKKLNPNFSLIEITKAYMKAGNFMKKQKKMLSSVFPDYYQNSDDIQIVILGRPYTVLSKAMNKHIPELFESLGINTYFQDMLPESEQAHAEIEPLLKALHWKFSAEIMTAAAYTAITPGLYPVYVTSFKCSPDSFTIDYFERLMELHEKPFLILELDEHDSSVGYETRIEAGIRAFRNHYRKDSRTNVITKHTYIHRFTKKTSPLRVNPVMTKDLSGKVLLFPNWDPITNPLLAANLQRTGIDIRLLREDSKMIQQSMQLNTGQCLPVSAIAAETMDYVQKENLDPSQTLIWIPKAKIACNIPMYPYFIKSIFEKAGNGMEHIGVYIGELTYFDISPVTSIHSYFAYMCGGLIRRLGCRIRPYELDPGLTDRTIEAAHGDLVSAFKGEKPLDTAISDMMERFDSIPKYTSARKPKVAIFGDLYVRDNDIFNQDLVHSIETAGGEVITTPYNEYAKIISTAYFRKWFKEGRYLTWLKNKSLLKTVELIERRFYSRFTESLNTIVTLDIHQAEELLNKFNIKVQQGGESLENILKIFHILQEHPDTTLFVHAVPSYCCPGLITEALSRDIERVTGVPVVSITYDGTGTPQNDKIIPYIAYRNSTRNSVIKGKPHQDS